MAKRPKPLVTLVWKRWKPFREVRLWPNTNPSKILIALMRAWIVVMIATMLLAGALAIAPIWDRAVFMQALRDSLSTDMETAPFFDQPSTDSPISHGHSAQLPINGAAQ
jgi:hypothetical protein